MKNIIKLILPLLIIAFLSGCSYRTSSNIKSGGPMGHSLAPVVITEGSLPDRQHKNLGPITVSIKKLTIFHADPTREQANAALTEKARAIGADAVINVTYKTGIGMTTWGYIDAHGFGVKFIE